MLSKLRFSLMMNTTCLMGHRVSNAVASTASGRGADTRGPAQSISTGGGGDTVGSSPAAQATATAARHAIAATRRPIDLLREEGRVIAARLPAVHAPAGASGGGERSQIATPSTDCGSTPVTSVST